MHRCVWNNCIAYNSIWILIINLQLTGGQKHPYEDECQGDDLREQPSSKKNTDPFMTTTSIRGNHVNTMSDSSSSFDIILPLASLQTPMDLLMDAAKAIHNFRASIGNQRSDYESKNETETGIHQRLGTAFQPLTPSLPNNWSTQSIGYGLSISCVVAVMIHKS